MCYVKRPASPSTVSSFQVPTQESINYAFPDPCITQMAWQVENFIPTPVSNPELSDLERKRKQDSGISVDLVVKRQKNKEAAARSREKKLNKLLELESQVKALENEKTILSLQLAISESEKKAALFREEEYKNRIQRLEEYLYKKEI